MELFENEIGEAAGKIWEVLQDNEPMSRTKIAKRTGLPTSLLNQGIGWLAREGKLMCEKRKRTQAIGLKE